MKIHQKPTIQLLLKQGLLFIGSKSTSVTFNNFVTNNFLWSGNSINWTQDNSHITINASEIDEYELSDFLSRTTIGKYEFVSMIYSINQPCIILKFKNLARYFDELVMLTNQCYFVGTSACNLDAWEWHFQDFVEFKQSNRLYLTGKSK